MAVAAVRGGSPLEQAADLEKKLSAKAAALRRSLLSDSPAPGAEASLRKAYRALAVSSIVRSAEFAEEPGGRARASSALKGMARSLTADGMPPSVLEVLTGPEESLAARDLLDGGWDAFTSSLGSGVRLKQTVRTVQHPPKPPTAELEESIDSVLRTCLEKDLPPAERSEGLFLAGLLYQSLSSADLSPEAAAPEPADDSASLPPEEEEPEPAEPRPEVPFVPKSVYAKASPSVVFILCSASDGAGEMGSGSVIDARGRVLTNAHVVIRDSTGKPWESIQVYLKPQRMSGDPDQDLKTPMAAKVIAHARALDLALLELDSPPAGIVPLPLGRPSDVSIGDRVAAIGHPEQGGLWTLTTGIVSTVVAELGGVKGRKAFQTDASINRGNSGGPLLNASGEFIGINTSMSRTGADGLAITSVNFAVRSDVAKRWLAKSGVSLAYAAAPPTQAPPKSVMEALGASASQGAFQDQFSQSAGSAESALEGLSIRKKEDRMERSAPSPSESLGGFDQSAGGGFAASVAPAAQSVGASSRSRSRAAAAKPAPKGREVVTESRPYNIERLLSGRLKSRR